MELLKLYWAFFKIGLFNFGGGYAMLPMIQREIVQKRGWATDDEIVDYFAVGQCTPGAIAVNVSTFIGYKRKGAVGGIIATLGLVTPAFFIIFLIATLLTNFADNAYVAHALSGIRVMVFFLVLSAIVKLCKKSCKDIFAAILAIVVGIMAIAIDAIPLVCYIIFAAIFGITLNVIKEKRKQKKSLAEEDSCEEEEVLEEKAEAKKHSTLAMIIKVVIAGLIYMALILSACTAISVYKGDYLLFKLYFQFAKIGLLAFGGGLATIPFLKELAVSTGWFTQTDLANMIAVSESTPGAMGINMSTYVGYMTCQNAYGNYFISFVGSMISTLGLVTPAIFVIALVSIALAKFKTNKYVEYAFYGLRAASVGLIIAAAWSIMQISLLNNVGLYSSLKSSFDGVTLKTFFSSVGNYFDTIVSWKNVGIGMIFGVLVFKLKKHPIFYILIAAVVGIILQM